MTEKEKEELKKVNQQARKTEKEEEELNNKSEKQQEDDQDEDLNVLGRKIHQPKGGHSGSHG